MYRPTLLKTKNVCCEPKIGYCRIPRTGDIAERRKAELIYCAKDEVENDECTSNGEGVVKGEIKEGGHHEEILRWGEGSWYMKGGAQNRAEENEVEIPMLEGHSFIYSETILQGRADRFGRLQVTLPA